MASHVGALHELLPTERAGGAAPVLLQVLRQRPPVAVDAAADRADEATGHVGWGQRYGR